MNGEWIDFGDNRSILNQTVTKNPLAIEIERNGLDPRETLRKALEKRVGNADLLNGLSDEDIRGILTLPIERKNGEKTEKVYSVLDFAHINEDEVTLQRSPTGIGEIIRAKNYAKIAKPIMEALGQDTDTLRVSQEAMDIMATADYDGDRVKTVIGRLGRQMAEAAVAQKKALDETIARYGDETKYLKETKNESEVIETPEAALAQIATASRSGQ